MPFLSVEQRRAYKRAWNAKNREKVNANQRRWSAENREKINANQRRYWAANPEKLERKLQSHRVWYDRNRAALNAAQRDWRKANPEEARAEGKRYAVKKAAYHRANRKQILSRSRERYFLQTYGISTQEREDMLAEQDYACAICKSLKPGSKRGWFVDHDHKTGRLRRILCLHCNVLLGCTRDNVAILRAAIEYLENFRCS